ncbi:protein-L-isoaspartate(D-aspartate) O-methyltransferase [Aquisalimonas lutea]|uniref:protein-L-isoaspartate(D-aspartate) O-methyltransferase n=1 Tax=Aquisalimonas lutea TaxID=1327750 RepID=UPI0025B4A046|nr:protein-L-isoaspartate(D-aspartate) O-methyltransferase [Aquisalimonas lutea]MDN3518408.1 protein-L-isoaspartate(D-aspartate) O-methyltransferase [Aquisalimonas lutea]
MKDENERRGIGMTSQRTRERLVQRLRQEGIRNEAVLNAVSSTPRHLFVDEALASRAYEDTALPIGDGQTISQPFVVARMTEALIDDGIPQRVLELGTGSGYQAAILAQLVPEVFTVERIQRLADQARRRLRELDYRNVRVRHGDGVTAWEGEAPFDGILVTAAPRGVPQELFAQLADGGRLVVPEGPQGHPQELVAYHRHGDELSRHGMGLVNFVPLVGGTQ